jgi:hypothetical protein
MAKVTRGNSKKSGKNQIAARSDHLVWGPDDLEFVQDSKIGRGTDRSGHLAWKADDVEHHGLEKTERPRNNRGKK